MNIKQRLAEIISNHDNTKKLAGILNVTGHELKSHLAKLLHASGKIETILNNFPEASETTPEPVSKKPAKSLKAVSKKSEELPETVSEKSEELPETVSEKSEELPETVSEKSEELPETVSEKIEELQTDKKN